MRRVLLSLCLSFSLSASALAQAPETLTIDATHLIGPHSQTPLNTVGSGRANEGLRADWQAQLSMVQREIGFHYIRFHGILHDDMGVYTEDHHGDPIYNFQYVDTLYDALLARHIRPFVELSFMPAALASGPQTVFWWKGNITPPKDMTKWNNLIKAFVIHLQSRYGVDEVNHWYFEVWNEPDLHNGFWTGSQADYFNLYKNTAESIRAVCPHCRVGGPATASGWEADWLNFIAANHVPADFLSTHTYGVVPSAPSPDGTAGTSLDPSPNAITGRVRHSRELIDHSLTPHLELHYTEWNSSYTAHDPILDQYIQAPYILEKLRATSPLAQSMSFWTFTDIFEEGGPPTRPFHGGFGLINLQGIRKPAYFAYKFLAQLGPTDIATTIPAHSWATTNSNGAVQVLFWNYTPIVPPSNSNDEVFYKREQPALRAPPTHLLIDHLANGTYQLNIYRTGYEQNDAYTAYLHMGSPDNLSPAQVQSLNHAASGAPTETRTLRITNNHFDQTFPMHQNDTVLVTLTPTN
ncbi:MAG: beta-xylosidase [Acidobacteriaceae bacterium]